MSVNPSTLEARNPGVTPPRHAASGREIALLTTLAMIAELGPRVAVVVFNDALWGALDALRDHAPSARSDP